MLEFKGKEIFQARPEVVYAALTDPARVAATIPDLESSDVVDWQTLRLVVRPGFSFLRGTMKLVMKIDAQEPPRLALMKIDASGIGVAMTILSRIQVDPEGAGAALTWEAQVPKLSGLVATVSPALIKAAAEQVIKRGWSAIRADVDKSQ